MDSSASDSDEFYECDDYEDVQKCSQSTSKKVAPDVIISPKTVTTDTEDQDISAGAKESGDANEISKSTKQTTNNNKEACDTHQKTTHSSEQNRNNSFSKSHIESSNIDKNDADTVEDLAKNIQMCMDLENNLNTQLKVNTSIDDQLTCSEDKENMWDDNENWEDKQNQNQEKDDNIVKPMEIVSTIESEIISTDNQWNVDEGWDDIESTPALESTTSYNDFKIDECTEKLKPTTKSTPKTETVSQPQKVDNLWNQDLWGNDDDDDGWGGVKTPTKEPIKPVEKEIEKSAHQTNSSKTEDDLWGEEEDWEIADDNIITNKPQTNQNKPIQNAFSTIVHPDNSGVWGGWGNWGISSVLSTAANITTTVSQGITSALETGIGVPDPEELARQHQAEIRNRKEGQQAGNHGDKQNLTEEKHAETDSELGVPFSLSNFVSGVSTITKLVETTGTKVIAGGLGTLETIGKKTYEVLQENDPQLKRKRAFLKKLEGEKPVLSQLLREAKDRADTENKERELRHYAKKANYETMFDDYQGLVHLEALEMLSKQCEIKLQMTLNQAEDMVEIQETMEQVKELCELTTEDDEDEEHNIDDIKEKINTALSEINIGISCTKLLGVFDHIITWIQDRKPVNPAEIHANAIENLAQVTAMAVEQYHKAGELLLVKEHRSTADEADSLVQLTTSLSALITILSNQYAAKLRSITADAQPVNEELKGLISNIFLEAANSSRYIEDAFQLLIPVIQVGAV